MGLYACCFDLALWKTPSSPLRGRAFRLAFSVRIVAVVRYWSVLSTIAPWPQQAYICHMRPGHIPQVLVLLAPWVCLASASASAQTNSDFPRCPASPEDERQQPNGTAPVKLIVDSLTFDKLVQLPNSVLDPMINQLKQCEFHSPHWLDEVLELWIRGTWQGEGFFMVLVDGWADLLSADSTHQHFSVMVHIKEGLQYRLGAVSFSVVPPPKETESAVVTRRDVEAENPDATADAPTKSIPLRRREHSEDVDHQSSALPPPSSIDPPVFPVERLRELLPIREGDILSAKKIREGLDNLKHLYGHAGYIDSTATPFTEVDDEHHTVDIRMDLDEQKQYRLRKLEINGLDVNTQAALVWKLKPGDVFDIELFDQFFEDDKALLPEGSSYQNAEVRRDQNQGKVDLRMHFHQYPSESISSRT